MDGSSYRLGMGLTVLTALRVTLVLVVFLVAVAGSGVYTPDISA